MDGADLGPQVARGVPGGHLEAGRLLQPVRGEEHPVGEGAELVPAAGPQPGLGQRGRDDLGAEPRRAQSGLEGELTRGVVGRQRLQQPPPLAADEQGDRGEVHVSILAGSRRAWGDRILALDLTEC